LNELFAILSVYGDEPSLWTGRLIGIGAIVLIVGVPILVIRSLRKSKQASPDVKDIYDGITGIPPPGEPQAGEVRLVFHTYSGFLVYTIQRKHDLVLPTDQAQILLDRMYKYNLTRGLFAYLPFFIAVLTFLEYRKRSKKIATASKHGFPMD
jgi:hypothetical protein